MYITDKKIDTEMFLSPSCDKTCGATVSFTGVVRDQNHGKSVKGIYYECYESMANRQIERIIDVVKEKTGVHSIRVLHRVGWLEVGDTAVVVTAASPHRKEAFLACQSVIDQIKEQVPIWKKEAYVDGTSEWVICCHQAVHQSQT